MRTFSVLLLASLMLSASGGSVAAELPARVWEKVEITLQADGLYDNPYIDVDVWVDLKGPNFDQRCYGFWDGGDVFRVRVLATEPGEWTWTSGSNPPDAGLAGKSGSFTATAWTDDEVRENPNRRGMIRAAEGGHAFCYADGEPYFLMGDTWWATSTQRFPWREDGKTRAIGPDAAFQDYVAYRKKQEYNCIAMIAAFPHWHNDGQPARIKAEDGTVIRMAWPQAGTDSAETMTNEAGERPFLFPGRVPGYEDMVPDLERINPAYFQSMDRKIDHLNAEGFVPFIEVARRDIGQVWKKHYPWPESYARYIQYVWSRYQANVCLFSPIHFDTPNASIPAEDWNEAAHLVIDRYGRPPFGTLCGTNAAPSSLLNWGHVDKARWLGFHQIGNRRTHDCYAYLSEIYEADPPVPAINGEPYYDGMEDAEGGTEKAALYCRSAMYGSVLSGGFGGHIYGAGGWQGGLWSGEVEEASRYPIWDVIQWRSADQMRHMKKFVLSVGDDYQDLIPATDLVSPNRTGEEQTLYGWAYAARSAERDLFLLYFEKTAPRASLSGALDDRPYAARWFNPCTGQWLPVALRVRADEDGLIELPAFPLGGGAKAPVDWALKLELTGGGN